MTGDQNIVIDILRKIQADVADVKRVQSDHGHQLIRIRDDLNNLRSDDLRREVMQTTIIQRLERIEIRLNLKDA